MGRPPSVVATAGVWLCTILCLLSNHNFVQGVWGLKQQRNSRVFRNRHNNNNLVGNEPPPMIPVVQRHRRLKEDKEALPTDFPTEYPTYVPTELPSLSPSVAPTTSAPVVMLTSFPTNPPKDQPEDNDDETEATATPTPPPSEVPVASPNAPTTPVTTITTTRALLSDFSLTLDGPRIDTNAVADSVQAYLETMPYESLEAVELEHTLSGLPDIFLRRRRLQADPPLLEVAFTGQAVFASETAPSDLLETQADFLNNIPELEAAINRDQDRDLTVSTVDVATAAVATPVDRDAPSSKGALIGGLVAAAVLLVLAIVAGVWRYRRSDAYLDKLPPPPPPPPMIIDDVPEGDTELSPNSAGPAPQPRTVKDLLPQQQQKQRGGLGDDALTQQPAVQLSPMGTVINSSMEEDDDEDDDDDDDDINGQVQVIHAVDNRPIQAPIQVGRQHPRQPPPPPPPPPPPAKSNRPQTFAPVVEQPRNKVSAETAATRASSSKMQQQQPKQAQVQSLQPQKIAADTTKAVVGMDGETCELQRVCSEDMDDYSLDGRGQPAASKWLNPAALSTNKSALNANANADPDYHSDNESQFTYGDIQDQASLAGDSIYTSPTSAGGEAEAATPFNPYGSKDDNGEGRLVSQAHSLSPNSLKNSLKRSLLKGNMNDNDDENGSQPSDEAEDELGRDLDGFAAELENARVA